jgi:threonine dehydratase
MFHYRNHGAAFGRILVGMQVGNKERAAVRRQLEKIGYRFWDETDNEAYRLYLGLNCCARVALSSIP